MNEKKVFVFNDSNEKLVGIETRPSLNLDKYPAVVLVHGFDVTKEEAGMFDDIAKVLSDEGFLVYRFDFSGCGESEGDYSKTSLSKLRSDLIKIMEFVKSQDSVDVSRIGLLGQSFGTSVVVSLEPDVKCIVLMGAIAHPRKILSLLFGDKLNVDGVSEAVRSDGRITKIGSQFWQDFDRFDLVESIRKIHCPVLFIHGSDDEKVPLSEMESLFENVKGSKENVVLEGATHGLRPCRDQMHALVVDWFKKYL